MAAQRSWACGALFQSTPSARRATDHHAHPAHEGVISIHALREEGDPALFVNAGHHRISIHALREEGDSLSS